MFEARDLKDFLISEIAKFVNDSANTLPETGYSIFSEPLVGFASAADPLFLTLKKPEVSGPHYRLPREWLPGAKTVISYFLPFSEVVRSANRKEGLPAMEWVYGRIEGESFNVLLRKSIIELLKQKGGSAVAPLLEEKYKVFDLRANWSERHTAYIAGLGTFGLSKSLITVKGCAGRYGSVITSLEIQPDSRDYEVYNTFCRHCQKCVERCLSGAIKPEGKDVNVCFKYIREVIKPKFAPRYGCGKCQNGVPCEGNMPG